MLEIDIRTMKNAVHILCLFWRLFRWYQLIRGSLFVSKKNNTNTQIVNGEFTHVPKFQKLGTILRLGCLGLKV